MEILVQVFLGIIALGAVLQAGFVAALAIGVRRAEAELEAFADDWDRKVLPLTRKVAEVTDGLVGASDGAVDQARRLEIRVSELAERLGRGVESAASGVESTVVDAAETIEDHLVPGIARRRGPLGRLRALWKGFREAASVYAD
jgi:hypothetical protein